MNDVEWLLAQSMLAHAKEQARAYSGSGRLWQRPYGAAQPAAASSLAPNWFTAYPLAVVTAPGRSVLATLGDPALWDALAAIGISGMHNGPMKQSGSVSSVTGRAFAPTIDGSFDRISFDIDPAYGSADEFRAMSDVARLHGAVVIDDIIPAHTGKGADFRLAEMGHSDYPGLYHMVAIEPCDWPLLPEVPEGADSVNLDAATVDRLASKGYIVGQLQRTIFYEPGVKETDWSVTAVVRGVDGTDRRWVYLHYFKAGQPSLNWADPSFLSAQMIVGDALHSLDEMGASMLRLDANGFLGVEPRTGGRAWSEGHPLSVTANQLIASMIRRAGGFSFQELNLAVDDIAAMSHGAADLSYDFVTRPAYHHALLTGDTSYLKLMFQIMGDFGINPGSLIHALQNHDELTLELVHFWTLHAEDHFELRGRTLTGTELRETIRAESYAALTGEQAPYNLRFVTNGVACTTATVIAAALGYRDVRSLSAEQAESIKQAHLLLAMYNALQPGVFALSGWDLVGALTLDPSEVAELLHDGDTRWTNRGAYDLLGADPSGTGRSAAGLPRAISLYGSLPSQLEDPSSFAGRLRTLLSIRSRLQLHAARLIEVAPSLSPGLLVLHHELPNGLGHQVTALNFGPAAVDETVTLSLEGRWVATDQLAEGPDLVLDGSELPVRLPGHRGTCYLLRHR